MIVAPSILSADFLNLGRDIEMLNNSEADWIHVDVMDGEFVPNISFGMNILSAIKTKAKKFLDVHLMIKHPERYLESFVNAGADQITVHYEACTHLHSIAEQIHSLGIKAGIAINPATSINCIDCILHELDQVIVMSVNPGFGGQKFIDYTYNKIIRLKQKIDNIGEWAANPYLTKTAIKARKPLIQIDGGVTLENAPMLKKLGVDVIVAGNTVFGSSDPTQTIKLLKNV